MSTAGSRITIDGIEAAQRAFRELEPKLAKRTIVRAERDALGIPATAAKSQWPVKTGASKKTIRIRVSKGLRGGGSQIAMALLVGQSGKSEKRGVSVGRGATKKIIKPWYSSLQELGWTLGKRIRKGGKVVGRVPGRGAGKKIPGRHIMKAALRASEDRVKTVMTERILQGIEELGSR